MSVDMTKQGLGLMPTPTDPRDYVYNISTSSFPDSFSFDLSTFKVHNQGKFQNCGTHALSSLVEIVLGCEPIAFSWYYGNRRYSEHKGQGTEARGLLKASQKDGGLYFETYPIEEEVSKVIETFENNYNKYKDIAKKIRIKNYYQCTTVDSVKDSLLKGYPVLVGTIIFKSFYEITKNNLVMPEPRISNGSLEPMAGGHMMLIVGYDKRGFKVLNSWGNEFGDNGTFIMPYSMVNWSATHGFPLPMFEAWAIDGIIVDDTDIKPIVKVGWHKIDGKWYYYDSNGKAKIGWLKYNSKWYYLQNDGSMKTGWFKTDGRWYYFTSNGDAVKGYQIIDSKPYYFAESWAGNVKECQLIITDNNGKIL